MNPIKCIWSMGLLEIMQLRLEHVLNLLDVLSQTMDVPFDIFFSMRVTSISWHRKFGFASPLTESFIPKLIQDYVKGDSI